jgi:acyl carrier protein
MELTGTALTDEVARVLTTVLDLDGRPLTADTPLYGSLPELDSMAVVEIVVALEERFGIAFDEEDLTADTFHTVGNVAALVAAKRP